MTRTIEAPGILTNEIDRSNYERTQDYSIVGTTALALGFADKGNDYIAEWINTMQTFEDLYGIPTNELEQYFYNAAAEQLGRGGVFVGVKLPYDNDMRDNYKYADYLVSSFKLEELPISADLSVGLSDSFDSTKPIVKIECLGSGIEPIQDLDNLLVGEKSLVEGTFRIVDITHQKYDKLNKNGIAAVKTTIVQTSEISNIVATNDCLGLVPVIVTPINAMHEQGMILQVISVGDSSISSQISDYCCLSTLNVEVNELKGRREDGPLSNEVSVDVNALSSCFSIPFNVLSNDQTETWTMSRLAALLFPTINYDSSWKIDLQSLNKIAVLVFQAFQDPTNDNNISFKLLERHIGSLDKTAKDGEGKAIYIDDIINSSSSCIRFFSNVNPRELQAASTTYINNLKAMSLGFFGAEAKKIINLDSILLKVKTTLEKYTNKDMLPIDLVVDAGITNAALLVASAYSHKPDGFKRFNLDVNSRVKDYWLKIESSEDTSAWRSTYKLLDNFCKNVRKDCMFINDGPRALCLQGDLKLVRDTKIGSSVSNTILPLLRYVASNELNSSYTASYCNWFLVPDVKTNEYFWIPPSIKALGCYTYTDAYFHTYDAPAGVIRGKLSNVVDTAFTPDKDEAGRLYSQGFNYAMNYPLDGIVIEGQKTMQLRKTAFDRVNVRRLFLSIEKQIGRVGKYFLYQGNTSFTRQRFTDLCRTILEAAVNGGGVAEYAIRCDETNNPPEVIDRNELHCRIAIKPVKTIEYIFLDFICTNLSADVTEEVVK